jgi:hypothetical protein
MEGRSLLLNRIVHFEPMNWVYFETKTTMNRVYFEKNPVYFETNRSN